MPTETKVFQIKDTYNIIWYSPNGETVSRYVKSFTQKQAVSAFFLNKVKPKIKQPPVSFGISWNQFMEMVGTDKLKVEIYAQREPELVLDLGL